ncbi:sensor histidine kinase [Paenibacillus lacisoli]|uniref:sensor histidine kinase n=1 Tax=Paenibacillus lacisoli TaxID=3064525 RepID=UPI0031F32F6C
MELITGISHDLRTPLTSIIGYIELLKSNSFQNEEEYQRFVQNAYHRAVHLKEMLDDLFEYTRLTSNETLLKLQRIDISQLLNQLLFEFEPIANENNILIEKRIKDSPVIALVDSEKMVRAIDNLLMNALKYSIKPGTVQVIMKTNEKQLMIQVENKGNPLTPEQVSKIFERFYKVDHSRTSEGIQSGAGLGLSIARNIVELHGGNLDFNHVDNSFQFTFSLPLS